MSAQLCFGLSLSWLTNKRKQGSGDSSSQDYGYKEIKLVEKETAMSSSHLCKTCMSRGRTTSIVSGSLCGFANDNS